MEPSPQMFTQNVNMDKDMIIEKIYVSQGDDVKKGDNLISFDMTLVEMELNIAKLKQQKQEQDLTKAQNRLTESSEWRSHHRRQYRQYR